MIFNPACGFCGVAIKNVVYAAKCSVCNKYFHESECADIHFERHGH